MDEPDHRGELVGQPGVAGAGEDGAGQAVRHGVGALQRLLDVAHRDRPVVGVAVGPDAQRRRLRRQLLDEGVEDLVRRVDALDPDLRFRSSIPFTSRAATAEALLAGQLDVGVLETVDAYLADGRLVLLADDLGLQPEGNVVPVVRRAVVDEHGAALVELLDAVTATLTTQGMTQLNRQVVLDGRPVPRVAAAWVERHGLGRPR